MWSKRGYKFSGWLGEKAPWLLDDLVSEFDEWQHMEITCPDCKKTVLRKDARNQYGYWQCYDCYKFDKDFDEEYK